ncbi:beta-N-acetylhexosaminidase [Pedobacter arcticus]|uniref:beta-N-acetylhexosaminidase n=1 Tax=Pedobacter arcticus TaxID=752140 RepID=UPI0002DBE433|nr:beta-N-acetylhexosaminidase [Pedobacter arcticus]
MKIKDAIFFKSRSIVQKSFIGICFLFNCVVYIPSAKALDVIPKPQTTKELPGTFSLSKKTRVLASKALENESTLLKEYLQTDYGVKAKNGKSSKSQINLVLDQSNAKNTNPEHYKLIVSKNTVTITAADNKGIFYGIQTLRQLINDKNGAATVNCVEITDEPRFGWREFMFDEARYIKGKDVVKQLLDQMAYLKMNVFHWHLTDNTGWRVEIKKYPLLTEIGAKRDSSEIKINKTRGGFYDGKRHDGFYTQEDVKEIVAYAAKRHITVVPEIDMPGHTSAAIAAYPFLGTLDYAIKVPHSFANQPNVLRVSDPRVWTFITEMLDEIMELFPSQVIHVGGDEVKYEHWKNSKEITEFIKEKGLKSPADLQVWFINKVSNYIESKGRRMMGWNDILGVKLHEYTDDADVSVKTKLAPNTIVDFWKGDLDLMKDALNQGYTAVNSLHSGTYLDYPNLSLKEAYSFDPVPDGLDAASQNRILGSACHMWSEWIPTVKNMQGMVFPRIAAYAETGWTAKDNKSYDDFMKSLPSFLRQLEKKGIYYKVDPSAD